MTSKILLTGALTLTSRERIFHLGTPFFTNSSQYDSNTKIANKSASSSGGNNDDNFGTEKDNIRFPNCTI